MVSQTQDDTDLSLREFDDLCYHVGLAMVTWQSVEDAHFKLFFKMLGAPKYQIASIVYYSTESFHSRHKMVSLMTSVFLERKEDKTEWSNKTGGLQKEIKDANDNRNKLAHYSSEIEAGEVTMLPDGGASVKMSERLQPSPYNVVSQLQGRTTDNPLHNLTVDDVKTYIGQWLALAKKITAFEERLAFPPQQINALHLFGVPPMHIVKAAPASEGVIARRPSSPIFPLATRHDL